MSREDLLAKLIRFVGRLGPDDLDRSRVLDDLQELASSLEPGDVATLADPGFSFERADLEVEPTVAEAHRVCLESVVGDVEGPSEPSYRVFRREAPVGRSPMRGSQPDWARGVAAERTIGPVRSRDGRWFWFDLFPIIKLVPLYLPGEPDPAVLFYVPTYTGFERFREAIEALLSQGASYTLTGSSMWVRADLLASGTPAHTYVGFEITSGEISVSEAPEDVDGKLTIPAGATCSVTLDLAKPSSAGAAADDIARDVIDASLDLPGSVSFFFSQGAKAVNSVGPAGWTLYGDALSLTWDASGSPAYETDLQGVLIPLSAGSEQISVRKSVSTFGTAAGGAAVQRAGWLLPVSTIDPAQPTPAAGNGGLAVLGNSTLSMTWPGLRDGPVSLPNPWIALSPGLLVILDSSAGNLYAHQRFQLWKDDDSAHRSSVHVRYTDSFPLLFVASAQGIAALAVRADAEAKLDRPVDAVGRALEIRSKDSLLLFSYSASTQLVFLYDDDILADNMDPQQTPSFGALDPITLALRNALFTTTPVNNFLLFAEMLDEEVVDVGNVLLLFGLYGFLPTLPDPYAARDGRFRSSLARSRDGGVLGMLLLGHVGWKKAPADDPDPVSTSFHILPTPGVTGLLMASDNAPETPGGTPQPAETEVVFAVSESLQARQDPYALFQLEQFALLDVSTNADWMGVSLAWFPPGAIRKDMHVVYKVYGAQSSGTGTQSLFPLQVQSLDLTAEGRFVRAFTVPQVSWEPLYNLTPPQVAGDPPIGVNLYPNDGGPTRLFNDNTEHVPIAPLPKVDELLGYFHAPSTGFTGALFTLPFGLRAFAELNRNHATLPDARLDTNQHHFRDGELRGALQLRADAPERSGESPMFMGGTQQLENVLELDGTEAHASTLGKSVRSIFNGEFFDDIGGYGERGVPLVRVDFCGYGMSTFSRWENPNAAFAETSQARFDVMVGRTAHEVIQVKSVVYPWAIRVVRTIVIFRVSTGYVYRYDTGWQAESAGEYDFSYWVNTPGGNRVQRDNPFEIHPGVVKAVHNVRNIRETSDIPALETKWTKAAAGANPLTNDNTYMDDANVEQPVVGTHTDDVELQPVFFDADVEIDNVVSGASKGKVPSKGMLGYVQLGPRGMPISKDLFAWVLNQQFGSLGGPIDCVIDVGGSGQKMRLVRVDVSKSTNVAGTEPLFVSTVRGSVVLPKEGSWSVARYQEVGGEVSPLPDGATVPLIREGKLGTVSNQPLRLAQPVELVRSVQSDSIGYALLQSTGTEKALFRRPRFMDGLDELISETPDFCDAYRMLNTSGLFPNLADSIPLDLTAGADNFKTKIIDQGYKLLDEANPNKVLERALPDGPWYIVNEEFLKIYVEYDKRDKDGAKTDDGKIKYGFDSAISDLGRRWFSELNNIGMVVDLGPLTRLVMIKGKFDAKKGEAPSFQGPELEFSEVLQPIVDLLEILAMLSTGDYAGALGKGLEVAMSNSAESWAYSFQAHKEIPVITFPPSSVSGAASPLKLEAGLKLGVYFNVAMADTGSPGQLVPSAGAFVGFYGRLSVMCFSVGVGTIYATGSVDLLLTADTKTGPGLMMKYGFGAEIAVGLPVVGTVSVLFMVGVEIYFDSTVVIVAGFLLFRGRAEILGGIVTVTISIEAKGIVQRTTTPPEKTDMIAQVTFGLDISIFWVINISFSESWEERRQIA